MDATPCNVFYVDRSIRKDRVYRSTRTDTTHREYSSLSPDAPYGYWESHALENNVRRLADVFGDVHLCATGGACISKLFHLQDESMVDLRPTIVLIDTPHDERIPLDFESQSQSRSPSPHSKPQLDLDDEPQSPPAEDVYGLRLLQAIVSEAHLRNMSKLIVPVPVIHFPASRTNTSDGPVAPGSEPVDLDETQFPRPDRPSSRTLLKRCLKLGATDVLLSPIRSQCITSLEILAYWAHKSAARDQQALMEFQRGRKRSWVGISDTRPYAYLRENMVATLMRKICQMESDDNNELPVEAVRLCISTRRRLLLASAIGSWHFSAHEFDQDELVEASALMFRHALTMPELAPWKIPTDQLVGFLIACRAAYNKFVPYHNFRHVVDVLQATFNFLVNIGALPPYPLPSSYEKPVTPRPKSALASLIQPFEALTLLITAIGHDVGHPGVNNGFLIELNTPLAQLYNDRSVLESFHCAAYSQILRRYWPSVFADTKMRKLMISSILATDMGLHFDYMKKLGSTQEKLAENNTTDGWNGRTLEDQAALACALLIKCADISNVARKHDTAVQWMHILSDEFSRQSSMEELLAIKSSLVAQPTKETVALYRSQLGFMNLFAIPLFQGVASVMPGLQYCVDELEVNKSLFEQGIANELAKQESDVGHALNGTFSPRSMSIAVPNSAKELKETPFNGSYCDEARTYASAKQRASEATDGSTSNPGGGDGASQATSATTGKMPLSPSTRGTSIVSRDSLDRPSSVPAVAFNTPFTTPFTTPFATADGDIPAKTLSDSASTAHVPGEDGASLSSDLYSNGASSGKVLPEERGLKKKTSRFRLFFRRHLSPSPPVPTSNGNPTADGPTF